MVAFTVLSTHTHEDTDAATTYLGHEFDTCLGRSKRVVDIGITGNASPQQ